MNKTVIGYPIRAVAKATGLPEDTLRSWERRYQAVTPERTNRGRLYGDAEVRRLLLLRRAVECGHTIGRLARLSDAELQELIARAECYAGDHRSGGAHASPTLRKLFDSLAVYDFDAVNEELGRLAALLRPRDLVHEVVLPVMRYAGENWEKGRLQVAHEHLLSAAVRSLLGGLIRLHAGGDRGGRLLLTTPPGELHEFGILAAAMLAAGQGFRVNYLGPNLPAREILFAAGKNKPRAVILGLTKINATRTVRAGIQRLRRELPEECELWIGGGGAATAVRGLPSDGLLQLDDFIGFESHLARLSAMPAVR